MQYNKVQLPICANQYSSSKTKIIQHLNEQLIPTIRDLLMWKYQHIVSSMIVLSLCVKYFSFIKFNYDFVLILYIFVNL